MSVKAIAPTLLVLAVLLGGCPSPDQPRTVETTPEQRADPTVTEATGPYAQRVDPPQDARQDATLSQFVRNIEQTPIPTAQEVGVPPYPGARIADASRGGAIETMQTQMRSLPRMTLLTNDSPAQVVEFYRTRLQGWQEREAGGMHWFWRGPEDFAPAMALDPIAPEEDHTVPYVAIDAVGAQLGRLMPGAQTQIDIRYEPVR